MQTFQIVRYGIQLLTCCTLTPEIQRFSKYKGKSSGTNSRERPGTVASHGFKSRTIALCSYFLRQCWREVGTSSALDPFRQTYGQTLISGAVKRKWARTASLRLDLKLWCAWGSWLLESSYRVDWTCVIAPIFVSRSHHLPSLSTSLQHTVDFRFLQGHLIWYECRFSCPLHLEGWMWDGSNGFL